MHCVYVLEHTRTYEIYIGKTDNLKRRVLEHNRGEQTATRRKQGTWVLIYAEAYRDKRDADARERKLKQHGSNKRWLIARIKFSKLED